MQILKTSKAILLLFAVTVLNNTVKAQAEFGGQFILGWNYGYYTRGLSNLSAILASSNYNYQGGFDYKDRGTGFMWGLRWEYGSPKAKIFGDMIWSNMHRKSTGSYNDVTNIPTLLAVKPRFNALMFDIGFAIRRVGFGLGLGRGSLSILEKRVKTSENKELKDVKWEKFTDFGYPARILGSDRMTFNFFVQYDFFIFMFRAGYMLDASKSAFSNSKELKFYYFNTNNIYFNTAIRLGKRVEGKGF